MRARLEIRAPTGPNRVEDGARTGSAEVEVRTTLELRAGEDLRAGEVEPRQPGIRDHRLRVHLPLPQLAATSVAECAYATVERGLTAEGGPTEQGLATYPSRRFVRAGGLTVAHEGLTGVRARRPRRRRAPPARWP